MQALTSKEQGFDAAEENLKNAREAIENELKQAQTLTLSFPEALNEGVQLFNKFSQLNPNNSEYLQEVISEIKQHNHNNLVKAVEVFRKKFSDIPEEDAMTFQLTLTWFIEIQFFYGKISLNSNAFFYDVHGSQVGIFNLINYGKEKLSKMQETETGKTETKETETEQTETKETETKETEMQAIDATAKKASNIDSFQQRVDAISNGYQALNAAAWLSALIGLSAEFSGGGYHQLNGVHPFLAIGVTIVAVLVCLGGFAFTADKIESHSSTLAI